MMADAANLLTVKGLRYTYRNGPSLVFADCTIAAGEAVALIGPSGCGKTTLLMLIAGLLTKQEGCIDIAGDSVDRLRGSAQDRWRGRTIGVVLQSFQLLPHLSVLENLTVSQYLAGVKVNASAARETLAALGIADLAGARPGRLSRGQVQRAAIARAVVNHPKLLLADEPTSSLDDKAAASSLQLLLEASDAGGAALLIATHDSRVLAQVPRYVVQQQVPAP
jgi:ABC-type lipoprotein export system ATPase subunit